MMTFLATSNKEDLLIHEVSDEALEAAGGNEVAARYTLANCTGLSECPGWSIGLEQHKKNWMRLRPKTEERISFSLSALTEHACCFARPRINRLFFCRRQDTLASGDLAPRPS